MGFGVGFGSFMDGLMKGYSFASGVKRQNDADLERQEKRGAEKRASESISDLMQAQKGTKQQRAGNLPTDTSGNVVSGPPEPVTENVVDLDQVQNLRLQSMRDIAQAHGPTAALQLNELFRQEDERVVRRAAGETIAALNTGDYNKALRAFNQTAIGGVAETISGNPKDGFLVKFKGEDKPQALTMDQIQTALAAKTEDFGSLLDRAAQDRQLAFQQKKEDNDVQHQQGVLDETIRHNKTMEGVYGDYYSGRNNASMIRAQGVVDRSEQLDKLYPDSMFQNTDVLTGNKSLDLDAKAAAKVLHGAFLSRGASDDRARAMVMDAIEAARAESKGDGKTYKMMLGTLMERAQGGPRPAPVSNGVQPVVAQETQTAPPAAQGIPKPEAKPATQPKPDPAPRDPLAGMGESDVRKMKAKLLDEKKRYVGQPAAAARLKEIDILLDRIDRRDY